MTRAEDPFERIRARAVAAVVALCALALLAPYRPIRDVLGEELGLAAVQSGIYLSAFAVLALLCARVGLDLRRLFGAPPSLRDARRAAAPVIPLLALALGTVYALFLPLSYAAPDFVQTWLLDSEPFFASDDAPHPLATNVLIAASTCLLAPVLEEFVFRGLLVHRWAVRWSLRRSVVLSAALFGALHLDAVGGVVFGLVATVLYLETRSLWTPILMHALHNLVVCLGVGAVELSLFGSTDEPSDIASFQADWWQGAIGLGIGVPWAVRFFRTRWRPDAWTLPHGPR